MVRHETIPKKAQRPQQVAEVLPAAMLVLVRSPVWVTTKLPHLSPTIMVPATGVAVSVKVLAVTALLATLYQLLLAGMGPFT
jgi:hypothetical protein